MTGGKKQPQMMIKPFKTLHIPNPEDRLISTVICLVNLVLSHSSLKAFLLSVLDGVIFELYFSDHMIECKINILQFVEEDLLEVIQDRDFEKLPASDKESIINQLHAKWTHLDSEVRNRIKLFAVRSPDILKPILESR